MKVYNHHSKNEYVFKNKKLQDSEVVNPETFKNEDQLFISIWNKYLGNNFTLLNYK